MCGLFTDKRLDTGMFEDYGCHYAGNDMNETYPWSQNGSAPEGCY
jgi:hypothetical protein